MKTFSKNDNSFICENCGKNIDKLGYTSRDHCPFCLCSKHVDINPGDRQNTCLGVMIPVDISTNQNKGYIIEYKCTKCGQSHNNKSADDDKFSTILKVMNKTYNVNDYKKSS